MLSTLCDIWVCHLVDHMRNITEIHIQPGSVLHSHTYEWGDNSLVCLESKFCLTTLLRRQSRAAMHGALNTMSKLQYCVPQHSPCAMRNHTQAVLEGSSESGCWAVLPP